MVDQVNKPSVYIGVQKKYESNRLFDNICFGLEEEGIPFDSYLSEAELNLLAQDAAQKSRLGVGIAVGNDNQIIIQHKKMNSDNPFFKKKINKPFQAKIMGSNAARLVKGIPIKEIPQEDDYYTLSEDFKQNNPVTENLETDKAKNEAENTANINPEKNRNLDSRDSNNFDSNSVDVEKITKLVIEALENIKQ